MKNVSPFLIVITLLLAACGGGPTTPAATTPPPPQNAGDAMERMLAAMEAAGSYRFEAAITGVNDQGPIDGRTYGEWVAPDRLHQRWEETGDGANEVLSADGRFFAKDPQGQWRPQMVRERIPPSAPLGVSLRTPDGARLLGEDVVDGVPVYVVANSETLEVGQVPEELGQGSVVRIESSFEWYISQQDYRLVQTKWRQDMPLFQSNLVDGTPVIEEIPQHAEHVFRFYDYGAAITIELPDEWEPAD